MEEQKEYEPNNYPPLNESKLVKEQKTDWLKITVAIFLGMMLGAIGFGLIVQTGMTEQFIPDHICNQQLNEYYDNGIDNGTILGYIIATNQEVTMACSTGNVTVFKINQTETPILWNYEGNNISRHTMKINEACNYYLNLSK